jgi:hypothetical protein
MRGHTDQMILKFNPHTDNPHEGTNGPTGFNNIFPIRITRMRGQTGQPDLIIYSPYG